jgi:hypothetical protein
MATQAELAQGYNDFINAITSGNFGEAANVAAGLGFSPAETEAFIEANAPGLGFDPGIDIPSDVIASYFDAPPVSYGPPSPAVSPAVSNSISLTPAGIAALAPSANVSSPANVFSPADYGPPSPILDSPATTPTMTRPEQEEALMQAYAKGQVDEFIDSVLRGASTGDFSEAADILSRNAANPLMGEDVYGVASNLLNTDPRFAGLREQVGGVAYTPSNLKSFVESQLVTQAAPVTPVIPVTPEGAAAPPTAQTTPGPGQIYGIPRFARQTQSNVPFAPLRRGLAQLRPAMYMPGLTSGQAPLGGSGFTPESLRNAIQSMTAAGQTPADVAYQMDVGGVSPAELSAAIGTPVGQIQAQYNQSRPGGLFSTGAPAPRGLPEDFVLQTGAYGAPTPTFFTPTPAKTTFPSGSSSANANQSLVGANSVSYDPGGGDGTENDPGGFSPSTDDGPAGVSTRAGGLIKMAEGGGPPKMAELSAKEAGSTFDISKYIDDQGRLVGGYSKPIYDDNRVITGYDYRPYERDVVFGEELREKEAAMRLTDAEREQMMVEMAMRQGRTGISPTTGGLAGIEIGDPMMRRRPQYYSTVEQFRPRYAEGGLANVAQNLAERGRKGDSMLVHMAPEEVAGLRALARAQGTDMTINPRTGLPEAFSLKKLFKAASFILPFVPIPGLFGMSSLLTKSILSGVAAGASAKGGFDLKQALGGGLRAYAMGSLGEKMSGAPTPDGAPTAPTTTSVPNAAAVDVMGSGAPTVTTPSGDVSLAGSYTGPATPASLPGAPQYKFSVQGPDVGSAGVSVPSLDAPFFPGDPTVPRPEGTPSFVTPEGQGFGKPITKGFDIAAAGIGGLSLEKAAEEQRSYEIEAAASKREDEERKRRFDELFARTLGSVRTAKAGGTINLAKGGMTYMEAGGTTGPTGEPRMVQGTGDGMSDSVPATIEGVQEARLANDEFVIPADVVADIGNGSSNAGAKKLYSMMDHIRKARHGTTKQPPEIRAERLMPA